MDYFELTAPCGLDCFNCHFYLAHENDAAMEMVKELSKKYQIPLDKMLCKGCRNHNGRLPLQLHVFGEDHRCGAYECSKRKELDFCGECDDFPCDYLHPYADQAADLPHNMKVFNLCQINKMGLEKWATEKSKSVRETYFTKPWSLSE